MVPGIESTNNVAGPLTDFVSLRGFVGSVKLDSTRLKFFFDAGDGAIGACNVVSVEIGLMDEIFLVPDDVSAVHFHPPTEVVS